MVFSSLCIFLSLIGPKPSLAGKCSVGLSLVLVILSVPEEPSLDNIQITDEESVARLMFENMVCPIHLSEP